MIRIQGWPNEAKKLTELNKQKYTQQMELTSRFNWLRNMKQKTSSYPIYQRTLETIKTSIVRN